MHIVNSGGRLAAAFCLAFLACSYLGESRADTANSAFARHIAGTYFVVEQGTGTQDLMTLHADGSFILTSSASQAFQFSTLQGAWRRTGRWQIAVKALDIDFNDNAIAVLRFVIDVDHDFQTLSGELEGALFADDVDPLDPDMDPILEFDDTLTGRRIIVD